jgi:hypothetical protein
MNQRKNVLAEKIVPVSAVVVMNAASVGRKRSK